MRERQWRPHRARRSSRPEAQNRLVAMWRSHEPIGRQHAVLDHAHRLDRASDQTDGPLANLFEYSPNHCRHPPLGFVSPVSGLEVPSIRPRRPWGAGAPAGMCKCEQLRVSEDKVFLRGRVTHLSLDGLATPLGRSQLLAVSERLQSMGWQCTILSLEPDSATEGTLDRFANVWLRVAFAGSIGPIAGRMGAVEERPVDDGRWFGMFSERTDLFHCRSYFGAFFPAAADVFRSVPVCF